MGNPAFYYYPNTGGRLVVLDWARPISDLYMVPSRVRVDALGGDGVAHSRLGPGSARVTIRRERFTTATLERQLRNLEDHLLRGGRVGFSWNHAKTWAAYASGPVSQGQTICYTHGTSFARWSSAGALASGDEIVLESPNPEMRREINTVSSITGGQITMGSVATFTFSQRVMVRWRGFYPALYLPADQIGRSLIVGDRGINWSFGAELAIDPRIWAVGLEGYTPDIATRFGAGVGSEVGGADLGLGGTTSAYAAAEETTLEDLLGLPGRTSSIRTGAPRK